MSVELLWG